MTLSCAKIQHHKDDTHFSQKQVEPGLNIPERPGREFILSWDVGNITSS